MTPATILEHDGIKQPISEWALDYGITPAIIIGRLERGATAADAITTPMKVGHRGQRLPTFSRKQSAIRPGSHLPREPRGHRVCERPTGRTHNAKPIEYDGLSLTVREWSNHCGVPFNTIYQRLRMGWAIADALTPGDGRSRCGNRALLARKAGIDPRTVDSRIRRGWPLELALSESPGARMGRFAHGRPGVVSDFERSKGTGAGSTAQAMASENNFSGNEA
ncbi:hypothetical protein [Agrobacterium tumefaciens]|jgi:hypothetical protein|uniref:hypothetical protein n=1 Tax=Agrobacterium tumefaciens TaxID=358 RepID=UPI000978104A|nr:hypothetical protein BV900_02400 [Agrobacterium tumefaciens]